MEQEKISRIFRATELFIYCSFPQGSRGFPVSFHSGNRSLFPPFFVVSRVLLRQVFSAQGILSFHNPVPQVAQGFQPFRFCIFFCKSLD